MRSKPPNQTQPTAAPTEEDIARVLKARFAHAGTHSGIQELCRILIHYRLRQQESEKR
jgi:hypothetical protein